MVEQAVTVMCQKGDVSKMEAILGMSSLIRQNNFILKDQESEDSRTDDPLRTEKMIDSKINIVMQQTDFKLQSQSDFPIIDESKNKVLEEIADTLIPTYNEVECEECGKYRRDQWSLNKHKKATHSALLNCERCSQSFKELYKLNNHKQECFYQCEICQFKHKQISTI